jgi:hypothetical protein
MEILGFENYLQEDLKPSLLNDLNTLQLLDKEFGGQHWGGLSQHGPVFLSWAALISRINEIIDEQVISI